MKCPALRSNDQSRPARRRHRPGRFRLTRCLTIRALAAGTLIAALELSTPARGTTCPSDHMPFDPGFGQPAAAR